MLKVRCHCCNILTTTDFKVQFMTRTQERSIFKSNWNLIQSGKPEDASEGKLPSHYSEEDVFNYITDLEAHNISPKKYADYLASLKSHKDAGTTLRQLLLLYVERFQSHTLDYISMHSALSLIYDRFTSLTRSQNQVSYHMCLSRAIQILEDKQLCKDILQCVTLFGIA